ncbi:TolB family protein [Fibrobacterota bacterium]
MKSLIRNINAIFGSPHKDFLALLILALFVNAQSSFNRNEAHLNWKTAETEHFRFYYDKQLEEVAEYISGIAEDVYSKVLVRYNIVLPGKVEFVVRDDIISNGFANPYQNTMQIWISDWGIPLRSTHHWLKDVVTHELSHLISIQSGSKLPASMAGLVIGYQDYFNEEVQSSMSTVYPFTTQPNWFAEGVAQYESQLAGYDAWDSHRDMILRIAVLEDSLLNYGRMGTFAGKGLHWEQGPYTQGFSFVLYLVDRYGDEAVRKLWVENSRFHRQTLSASMKRVLGRSGEELWEDWKNRLTSYYNEQLEAIGNQVYGEKLSEGSFYNNYPKWDSKGENIFFISNKGSQWFKASLYKYQLADSLEKDEKQVFVSGTVGGYFDLHPDDSTFLFASARNKDKNGMARLDVFQDKLIRKKSFLSFGNKEEKRLTENLNAVQGHYNPEAGQFVFIRNKLSNFYLCTAPVPEGKTNTADDIKTVFPSEDFLQGRFGFNIYTPKFSPDGTSILFSFYDGKSRKIGRVQPDGSGFEVLLDRPFDDRDPEWTSDGKSFIFSSDSTGIFNLYSYDLEQTSIKPLTNVAGGAFAPSLSPDGRHIAYINFDADGFSLYLLRNWTFLDSLRAGAGVVHHDTSEIQPIEFTGVREDYLGIPNRFIYQPLLIGQEISAVDKLGTKGASKWLAGLSVFGNDPVYKNEIAAAILLELGNGLDYAGTYNDLLNPDKESELFFNYWNHAFPVSAGIGLARKNIVSWDSIVHQDARNGGGDSLEISNHAITLKNAQLMLKYNLFQTELMSDPLKASFISLAFGRTWDEFDFYEIPFSFSFYENLYLSSSLWFYGVAPSSKSNVAPKGMAAFCNYSLNFSNLFRGGSFRETFVFDNGAIKPVFKEFTLHELDFGLDYGLAVPWSAYSSLRLSGIMGSILDWDRNDAKVDTLNSFFQRGIFLRGYPYLQNTEELLFRGENTIQFSADLNQVVVSDIFRRYWIVFVEDIYAQLFWEAGRAWDGKFHEARLFEQHYWDESRHTDAWFHSVGWGLKLNSRIYHNFPFNVFFEAASALNRVPMVYHVTPTATNPNPEPIRTLEKLDIVELFGLNTYATRVSMGITFGFYNGLLSGSSGKKVNPASFRKTTRFFNR